jgi:hypothetical protein
MIRRIFIVALSVLSVIGVKAQGDDPNISGKGLNAIPTTVPFLTISPDSRAGAMGDAGVATSPDLNSQNWNAAKYLFMKDKIGFGLSYTPWLKKLQVNDLNLVYLSGYYKFDAKQTLSLGLRYFNLGTIQYTNEVGEPAGTGKPNEFAFDLGYSRLLSDYLGAGLVLRFIYSDIAGGKGTLNNIVYNPGVSVAADWDMYYQRPITVNGMDAEMAYGLAITNIGFKMSYSSGDTKEFIPTTMRLGGRFSIDLDDYNSLSATIDLSKLLVPTPPKLDGDSIVSGRSNDVSTLAGMIQSFYDAPGWFDENGNLAKNSRFLEEMQEIMIGGGAEYWYRKQFAVRAGYFYEHENKGDRKYVTAGIGLKLNVFSLDFSYLKSMGRTSPLDGTLRFTLGFIFK